MVVGRNCRRDYPMRPPTTPQRSLSCCSVPEVSCVRQTAAAAGRPVCEHERRLFLWRACCSPCTSSASLLRFFHLPLLALPPGKGEGAFVCSILSVPTVNFTTDGLAIRLIDWMVFRLQKRSLVCDYIYGRFNVFKRLKVTIFSSQRLSTRRTPSCVQEDLFAANGES